MEPKTNSIGFWEGLPKPFLCLAPLEDVSDAAFRRLIAHKGKPHVFFTEFTSADGLAVAPPEGQRTLRKKLLFSEGERPIIAQLFSSNAERMEKACAIVADLGFDGIDINMGCPDKSVEKSGCGSAMIKHPETAKLIIRAAKRGAGNLPVSVKTRIGYAKNELKTWVPTLLDEGIANLTIHARTRNEMSDVPARWEHVRETVEIRDAMRVETKITGNGDVWSLGDARTKAGETGCDGVMLGRAIFGNPWLFTARESEPGPRERMEALIEHITLFQELLESTTNPAVMKRHFKSYIQGWDGAKDLRVRLMESVSLGDARGILVEAISEL